MDFRFSPEAERFRDELRTFLDEVLANAPAHRDPSDLTGLTEDFERSIHRLAGARGFLGLTGEERAVFDFEVARADAPLVDTAMTLAGPAVSTYGSKAQRAHLLPQMAAGEVTMCIAYTEASAGSDLTSIEAVASPDGEGWVLTGRKVLVTGAHKADWCCTIAWTRPGAPPREGMTMFLVDMHRPGVEVVRRPTMNGWDLDEITFDAVRLTPDDVLGVVGSGWRQLAGAVSAERSGMFWLGFARHLLDLLVEVVGSGPRRDDPVALDLLGRCAVAYADAERLARRTRWASDHEEQVGALPAMSKVTATELLQMLATAGMELAGSDGLAWSPLFSPDPARDGRLAWEYLERVHGTISVGANELQRDVIAQVGLGLSRRR